MTWGLQFQRVRRNERLETRYHFTSTVSESVIAQLGLWTHCIFLIPLSPLRASRHQARARHHSPPPTVQTVNAIG